ncbi:MAG: glycosyltransferase family 39 protein [Polyangiaceae bacterium]|nr:glycosyltransferase family 39 protein [Polyangiaceae bacterium]
MGFAALALRLLVVAWAAPRFPPVADGAIYHDIAARIASGSGYVAAWPDGTIHAAGHYPVGYPGALAGLYALFGATPLVAMLLNALLGALCVAAVHRLLVPLDRGRTRAALLGAALVAVHPGLVAYTPALMAEGAAACLWTLGLVGAVAARRARTRPRAIGALVTTGVLAGLGCLVRPETALLVPWLGAAAAPVGRAGRPWWRVLGTAAAVGALAAAVAAPWVARNCAVMGRCTLSLNAGWNLLIGTDAAARGKYAPLVVPEGCAEVPGEAEQDACFARAAWGRIGADPAGWLALAPRKLAGTFDVCNAGGWYLHASNPDAFGAPARTALGVVEIAFERGVLLAALVGAAPRRRARGARASTARLLVLVGLVAALTPAGWIAFVGLIGALALRRPGPLHGASPHLAVLATLLVTAVVHVVFFGEGRYVVPALPSLVALAALGLCRLRWRAPSTPATSHAPSASAQTPASSE